MVGDEGGLAAIFVGVEDGLTPPCSAHAVWLRFKLSRYRAGAWLAQGRDVEKSGGDEVGGFRTGELLGFAFGRRLTKQPQAKPEGGRKGVRGLVTPREPGDATADPLR